MAALIGASLARCGRRDRGHRHRQRGHQRAQGESTAAPADLGDETILVVEDEDSVRRAVVRVLEGAGYHVLAASNARDARRVLDSYEGPVDFLLTDVIMPGDDGPTLAGSLLERMPGLRVLS